jgi:hypothetical protein
VHLNQQVGVYFIHIKKETIIIIEKCIGKGEIGMENMFSKIKPLKEREAFRDKVLDERLNTILPKLMEEHGTEMWLTISREYNEDPVISTFFPSAVDSSRRLTIFIFCRDKEGGDRAVCSSSELCL